MLGASEYDDAEAAAFADADAAAAAAEAQEEEDDNASHLPSFADDATREAHRELRARTHCCSLRARAARAGQTLVACILRVRMRALTRANLCAFLCPSRRLSARWRA